MLVIGRKPVIETIKYSPLTVKRIFILNSSRDNKIEMIEKEAGLKNIPVEKLNKSDFEIMLGVKDKSEGISQGIIADVKEFTYLKTNDILRSIERKEYSTIIILDEIQDPHNLGAIIRSAAASEADGVIISEKNSVKVNHTVIKSAAGATNFIKISKENNIYSTIDFLKSKGFEIIGTSLNTQSQLYQIEFTNKIAVILGNEEKGIRKNILKLCDVLLKIPINKNINSLNVSVSAGVILYEILRQRYYSNK